MVTKRGVEAAVLVPVDVWRRMEQTSRITLKDLLLSDEARTDSLVPARHGGVRRRDIVTFD